MAKRAQAVKENVPGSFFVDDSCINCGTCYHYAPDVFTDVGGSSAVHQQPADQLHIAQASRALLSCPTNSIGSDQPSTVKSYASSLPDAVCPKVWFNGYTSEHTFGAWSYVIEAAEGNILMDCPRPVPALRKRIDAMGGISKIVLSHKDDIAGHAEHAAYWQAHRVAHSREHIDGVEMTIDGDEPVNLGDDLLVIPCPGHSHGSICLLFEERVLFTGDHLWWNPKLQQLSASKTYCWYDWDTQLTSIENLLNYNFSIVCPGHGAIHRTTNPEAMCEDLHKALERLQRL